jgi:PIN domain nuclease of toxin-antitoxin system
MPTLLDTHAWVWWVAKDPRMSKRAKTVVEKSSRRGELWVSMISIWEVAKKVEKRRLVLDRPLDQWLDEATAVDGLRWSELTRPVLLESCRLPPPFHGDPADQLIVATARHLGAAVVTKDERIRNYAEVRSIW